MIITDLEKKVLEMVSNGVNPHGPMRDILIDMQLRLSEEKEVK